MASRDGRQWRDVFELPEIGSAYTDWSAGLLAVHGGYVVIGAREDSIAKTTGTILATSADGVTWSVGPTDPVLQFASVFEATTDGSRVVFFGLNNGITGCTWVTDKLP